MKTCPLLYLPPEFVTLPPEFENKFTVGPMPAISASTRCDLLRELVYLLKQSR